MRSRGVVAPSSGNHAQAVALAAKLFGVKATVVIAPTTVTAAKRGGAERPWCARRACRDDDRRSHGSRAGIGRTRKVLRSFLRTTNPWIIAGRERSGWRSRQILPNVESVLVPVGGGGFSAGVATAIKPPSFQGARDRRVEPTGAAKLSRARAAGKPGEARASAAVSPTVCSRSKLDISHSHIISNTSTT